MKEKVLSKAKELFRQFGYKTVTMDEVARQLGVSKKTLYELYASKDELVGAVVESLQEDIAQEIAQSIDERYNAIEQMYATQRQLQRALGVLHSSKLNWELQRYYPKACQAQDTRAKEQMKKYLYQNIQQGIAEELYRPELDMQFLFYFFWGITRNEWNDMVYPAHKFSYEEIDRYHIEYFVRIMATPKGFAVLDKIMKEEN
ncbi:TetR/AcrR family transcriptional regulator [Ornithobacterium rhinotracheale]|uniref:TetR/AcrR family transcriptional regulator n=1 Tax=Ornithobacterium rhinotracheale TaxID=28251 RepID=A0A3R5YX32_ORNRH|nr:TetR/AcrR family transcriptional regulator [Ornithobacterium rhinotracheale]QAR31567.1 TetR/AcrR family transcriptional regulator [Ornithobacterium rhinotracheale]